MRLVCWNVETLAGRLAELPGVVEEELGAPDVLCLQEVRISPDLVPRVRAATIMERHRWSDHAPLALELG